MTDANAGALVGNELIGGVQGQAAGVMQSIQSTLLGGTLNLSQNEILLVLGLIGLVIVLWKAEAMGKWVMVACILIVFLVVLGVFNF